MDIKHLNETIHNAITEIKHASGVIQFLQEVYQKLEINAESKFGSNVVFNYIKERLKETENLLYELDSKTKTENE